MTRKMRISAMTPSLTPRVQSTKIVAQKCDFLVHDRRECDFIATEYFASLTPTHFIEGDANDLEAQIHLRGACCRSPTARQYGLRPDCNADIAFQLGDLLRVAGRHHHGRCQRHLERGPRHQHAADSHAKNRRRMASGTTRSEPASSTMPRPAT